MTDQRHPNNTRAARIELCRRIIAFLPGWLSEGRTVFQAPGLERGCYQGKSRDGRSQRHMRHPLGHSQHLRIVQLPQCGYLRWPADVLQRLHP